MKSEKAFLKAHLWLAIAGLLIFLFINPLPKHTLFWKMLQDTGHFPLFGTVSILLLPIISHAAQRLNMARHAVYLLSFLLTVLLAVLVEAIQGFIPDREVSLNDFYLGTVGSLCFLLGFSVFDTALRLATSPPRKILITTTSLSLLLVGVFPLLSLTTDYINKQQAFPTLLTFEQPWPRPFLSIYKNEQLPGEPPQKTTNTPVRYLRFKPDTNAQWPFIRLDEVAADWRQYRSIQFNFISNAHEPVPITILLDDQHIRSAGQHSQRYHRQLIPGPNRITLPVMPLQLTNPIDLEHMASIWIAFPEPRPDSEVLIGEIRLR